MKTITLPAGEQRPALGLGTWRLGESAGRRAGEIAAVRLALDLGYRVIDSAEMYGEGGAEEVVGAALAPALRSGLRRDELFVVSKVYPHNASRAGVVAACERSLRRLGLDTIDLYLLHWRGDVPLGETVAGFEALRAAGRIRHWGVSNFDVHDLEELLGVDGGAACAVNQVYFSLSERGAGFDLLPWQRRHGMPLMAYCPIDHGRLLRDERLAEPAARLGLSAAQLGLAWVMHQAGTLAIPKAVREAHLRENLAAADVVLPPPVLLELDRLFPPPRQKLPLAIS